MDELNTSLIFSVSPASGPAGSTVTLTGTGFFGVTAVYFGTVRAPTFDVVSPSEITATVPPGSGTVQVTVRGLLGPSLNSVAFTYAAVAPVLAAVSPPSGPVGRTVTLTGTGFSG
ncbi:IPT/TIG domain-containing protein, partial [Kitasatospora sp. RB6PN24]|uniref:IPT/TIG domain-containing protein n=1 Tax=Kitasatospora humi TaxID=2893891 RepID=UPI001E50B3D8